MKEQNLSDLPFSDPEAEFFHRVVKLMLSNGHSFDPKDVEAVKNVLDGNNSNRWKNVPVGGLIVQAEISQENKIAKLSVYFDPNID